MSIHLSNLTSKQKKVYTVIENYLKVHGIPPTVREIGEMVGEKTPGAVQGILNRLEQKGVIKRQVGMARSIQLVSADNTMYSDPVFIPEIKKISKRNIDDLLSIYNVTKYHPFSPELVDPEKKHFLFRCQDDSAADRDIHEDDLLLVGMDSEPQEGDVVLAFFDGHTLLRSWEETNEPETLKLVGDKSFIDKEEFSPEEVTVIGTISGKYTSLKKRDSVLEG